MSSRKQQFIYRLKLTRPALLVDGPTPEEAAALAAHGQHLSRLASESVVLLAGRTQVDTPDAYGIVLFRAACLQDAEAIMASDPAVSSGVMSAELHPYAIAMIAEDFVHLAADSDK